jgi:hypothetical protein
MELKWNSTAGLNYQVEESTDAHHWQVATTAPFVGTGSSMCWNAPETPDKRFYRLRVS